MLCPRRRPPHLCPVRLPRDNLQRGRRYCMSDARVSFSVSLCFCFSWFFLRRRTQHRWRRKDPLCKMAAEDICAMLLRSQSPFPDALSGSPIAKTEDGGDDGDGSGGDGC